jgi:hypothetical protein
MIRYYNIRNQSSFPLSTKKSLRQVYEILNAASNLEIEYSDKINMVDCNYN